MKTVFSPSRTFIRGCSEMPSIVDGRELLILGYAIFDYAVGGWVGPRFMEYQ
jgi:hypothetical protein